VKKEDIDRIDDFNKEIHTRINEVINQVLEKYGFVKKVNYKLTVDM